MCYSYPEIESADLYECRLFNNWTNSVRLPSLIKSLTLTWIFFRCSPHPAPRSVPLVTVWVAGLYVTLTSPVFWVEMGDMVTPLCADYLPCLMDTAASCDEITCELMTLVTLVPNIWTCNSKNCLKSASKLLKRFIQIYYISYMIQHFVHCKYDY